MCDKEIREIDEQIISLVLQRKKILWLYNYKIDNNYGNKFIHGINYHYESYNTKYLIDVFNSINK